MTPVQEVAFIYRCRRCGTIQHNPPVSAEQALPQLLAICNGRAQATPGLYEAHTCADGGGGVMDLQGYAPVVSVPDKP